MNIDPFDDEMHALLSGYSMGTLSAAESARLFEKAIGNQTLFDALMDEESARAALDSPIAKRALANALAQMDAERGTLPIHASMAAPAQISPISPISGPRTNPWLWTALASILVIGVVSVAWLRSPPTGEQPTQVAIVQPSKEPLLTPPFAESQEATALQAPRRADAAAQRATQHAALKKETNQPASPPPAGPAEREERVIQSAPMVVAEAKLADKLEVTKAAPAPSTQSNSFRGSTARSAASSASPGAVQLAKARQAAPVAFILKNQLVLQPSSAGFAYAFIIDGDSIKPLLEPAGSALAADTRREFSLGTPSPTAQVWLLLTPTPDPILERALSGVLPLPLRNWIKLTIP